ncbi:hypothetical protein LG52_2853 [Geobacillus kaustophilus]|uniref:Uncharacterized protein n=1 Tax=Geobacillus kaustophilus TaxID=1462 RepID=A0A0D8BR77_GEOKU|nr:hypothetical protein LG52_2853 [Geobacillus kaustophilus]
MQRNHWLTTIKQRRQGWSSLYARPIDVGGIVVFHSPFRCFAAIRSKLSHRGSFNDKGGDAQ